MSAPTTYLPGHFEERDLATLHAFIEANPLATWATTQDGELVVHHVPFRLDRTRGPFGTLVGHVARANPVWRAPQPSLLVFGGPQAYVSPGWYASKPLHGKVVPTWNYAVVHARGTPVVLEDAASVLRIVSALTDTHEARQAHPWQVGDAPPEFVDQMLRAIVGIEIPIEQLVGKWKVSQNRSADDRAGVAAGLRAQDPADPMAALVAPPSP
ncbi:FMN-binding negative transcriptional regulator [Roseateles puraquae]|uniref:Transcriptional regulator n=1 Tax=Roseateles puraquae TaxID=431059 RepID=A0A254N8P2_9BURK|nr:FMN-binding negative transcriptional regulator [Roseateles puraquae]MDG0854926.1 FMN-binding negative transcriptional regulator [Roseateles puraquae]OWR04376.1 transcriptional regulator [Roseateles puraquae]